MFAEFTITGGKKVMVNLLRVGYITPAPKGTGTQLVFDPGQQETGIPSNIIVQEAYVTVTALLGERKVKP